MTEPRTAGQIFAFVGVEQPFVLPKVDLKSVVYRLFQVEPRIEIPIAQPTVRETADMFSGSPYWAWKVPVDLGPGAYRLEIEYEFPGPRAELLKGKAVMEIMVTKEQALQTVPVPSNYDTGQLCVRCGKEIDWIPYLISDGPACNECYALWQNERFGG